MLNLPTKIVLGTIFIFVLAWAQTKYMEGNELQNWKNIKQSLGFK